MRSLCIFEKCRGAEPPVEIFGGCYKEANCCIPNTGTTQVRRKKIGPSANRRLKQSGFLRNSTVANVLPLRPKTNYDWLEFLPFHCHRDGNRVKNIILTYLPLASAICVENQHVL